MTLEQWAYIGQIVASIAVIASLIYVARQLQQNTNAMIVSNADNFVNFNFQLNTPFALKREFAELWVKAGSSLGDLDEVDRQWLIIWEFRAIAAWSNWFNLRQQGLISDAQWSELESTFEQFGQRQSVREAWKVLKAGYTEAYRGYMARYFAH